MPGVAPVFAHGPLTWLLDCKTMLVRVPPDHAIVAWLPGPLATDNIGNAAGTKLKLLMNWLAADPPSAPVNPTYPTVSPRTDTASAMVMFVVKVTVETVSV